MIKTKLVFVIFLAPFVSFGQEEYEEYDIDEFYKKVELEHGVLNEEGEEIDYVFKEETMEEGKYEVEITDGPGDLYEIKGTGYFVRFDDYYGHAGYGDEGILKVGSWSSASFYKRE